MHRNDHLHSYLHPHEADQLPQQPLHLLRPPQAIPHDNTSVGIQFTADYGGLRHSLMTSLQPSHRSGAWIAAPGSSHALAPPRVVVSGWVAAPQPVSVSAQVPYQYEWTVEPQQNFADHGSRPKHVKRFLKRKRVKERPMGRLSALQDDEHSHFKKANLDQPTTATTVSSSDIDIPLEAVHTATKVKPLEKGPGWCSVCQRDCVTVDMLQMHMNGKNHRKQAQRQTGLVQVNVAEAETDTNVQGVSMKDVFEQIWQLGSSTGQGCHSVMPEPNVGKQDVDDGVALGTVMNDKDKRTPKGESNTEEDSYNSAIIKGLHSAAVDKRCEITKKKLTRCELCNVDCDTKAVLEIHFGGKKHAARLRSLQMQTGDFSKNL